MNKRVTTIMDSSIEPSLEYSRLRRANPTTPRCPGLAERSASGPARGPRRSPERFEIREEVGELLRREVGVEPVRHEGGRSGGPLLDLRLRDGVVAAVGIAQGEDIGRLGPQQAGDHPA